ANAMTFQGSVIGLGATSGAGAVPLFTTPRTVTRFALQIAMIASNASIQRFAAADARNDGKRKAALLLLGLGASTVILLPAALALLVFGPWVVARWTHGTVEIGLGMMLPLALSMLLAGLWMPLGNLLIALNRHTGYALVFTIVSLACVGAGALASAFAGITAMAWAIAALDLLMAAWIATRFAQGGIVSRAQMIDCLWELAGRMRSM
ncbi:MAG: hypothetical protein KDE63_13825, partial [Novosphingobium sp.]|nr:hypothetical protein [Novosphingobium sp.]